MLEGWVITCRKKGLSNSPGSLTTHKSSSNESFLSKQGAKTNWTRSPSCPTSPSIPRSLLPSSWEEFLWGKKRCSSAKLHWSKEVNTTTSIPCSEPKLQKNPNIILRGFYTSSSDGRRKTTDPVTGNIIRTKEGSWTYADGLFFHGNLLLQRIQKLLQGCSGRHS